MSRNWFGLDGFEEPLDRCIPVAVTLGTDLERELLPLVEEKSAVIQSWMDEGKLAKTNPRHLLFCKRYNAPPF